MASSLSLGFVDTVPLPFKIPPERLFLEPGQRKSTFGEYFVRGNQGLHVTPAAPAFLPPAEPAQESTHSSLARLFSADSH